MGSIYTLSIEERRAFRRSLAPLLSKAQELANVSGVDFETLDQDLTFFTNHPVQPPKLLKNGLLSLPSVTKKLAYLQTRRNKLVRMKVVCSSLLGQWNILLKRARSLLQSQQSVTKLKNAALRDAAISLVIGAFEEDHERLGSFVEQIETQLWALTNNQKAMTDQLVAYKLLMLE